MGRVWWTLDHTGCASAGVAVVVSATLALSWEGNLGIVIGGLGMEGTEVDVSPTVLRMCGLTRNKVSVAADSDRWGLKFTILPGRWRGEEEGDGN